tara:strand:- start:113 stop:1906 length:1794 start_codon:yes stop_codon:yes gene_type:complete
MCGIAGIISLRGSALPEKNIISKMLSEIRYRGPDDTGVLYEDDCYIGNNRLSIIDLETGNQPISANKGRYTIVYNGEVYNFKDIRSQLEKSGVKFKTKSDTEVILRGFIARDIDILQELNGIFSFAIWDSKKHSLFLARDHMGIKPLYYFKNGKYFVFGSEIKSIFASGICEKKFNRNAIFDYFCRQSPGYLDTMYDSIYELQPGTWIKINKTGDEQKGKYFSLENSWREINSLPKNEKDICLFVKEKIRESVVRQLVSDVPVGVLLSGGIDSSILFNYMYGEYSSTSIHAFTYTNSGRNVNEIKKASSLVESIDHDIQHHILPVHINNHLNYFDEACRILDSPVCYPSSVSILLLSRLAKKKGIKVVISGQGADELFLGYERYFRWAKQGLLNDRNMDNWAKCLYFGGGIDKIDFVESLTGQSRDYIEDSVIYNWVHEFKDIPPLKRISLFDQKFRLLDLLKRDDRMGMGGSVEIRVPFFDKEMVVYSNALDDSWKMNDLNQKYILKKIAKNILPDNIVNAPKMGSPTDIGAWLKTPEFISLLIESVSTEKSFSKNYLYFDKVQQIISKHERNFQFSHLCWCFFSMERWYQNSFLD